MHRTPLWCAAIGSIGMSVALAAPALGQTVWDADDGTTTFTKADHTGTNPALNDPITPSVSITRPNTGILEDVNLAGGAGVNEFEFAFSGLNSNPSFAFGDGAANYASLTFDVMDAALNNQVGVFITNRPGVLYLIDDDIYVDIIFTHWQAGGGGGFSYERAIPTPGAMAILTIAGLSATRRRRA